MDVVLLEEAAVGLGMVCRDELGVVQGCSVLQVRGKSGRFAWLKLVLSLKACGWLID